MTSLPPLVIVVVALFLDNRLVRGSEFPLNGSPREQLPCSIEITVSPIATKHYLRPLDLSWENEQCWQPGDWVALYNFPPVNRSQSTIFSKEISANENWVRTNVEEKRTFPAEPNFKKTCLGWYAAYWRKSDNETEPVSTVCLTTNPTWMRDNWDDIKDIRLDKLFLPGTHDSGAYQLAYRPFEPTRVQKYIYAQDESILEQLIHGARYLDFRIGRYDSGFWLNHDIARVHILEYALQDVKQFLDSTEEIVIIDFHGFPIGFKKRLESHDELVQFLQTHLKGYLVGFMGHGVTLQQIHNTGKRLIVAYNDYNVVTKNRLYLWYPIPQKWGDVRSVSDLRNYLSNIFASGQYRNSIWAAMAEMTPDTWGVITDKFKGLRTMADNCNHNVTDWFKNDWGERANIVAVDFIRSSGIVSTAIAWNKVKGRRQRRFLV